MVSSGRNDSHLHLQLYNDKKSLTQNRYMSFIRVF